jgi:alanine dehydrogenase
MNFKIIYIRNETIREEYRAPLVPNDVNVLIENGFTIYVESNETSTRFFTDSEYATVGAIVTNKKWYEMEHQEQLLIIGIKELSDTDLSKLDSHTHMYFSHSFKGQQHSRKILDAFTSSNSMLYDFEYFTDEFGKRLLSFCYYAGVVGCHYGLLYTDRVIDKQTIQIAIIGNGKCSKGIQDVLYSLSLPFKVIGRDKDGIDFTSFDIIYNCILLEKTNNEVWFDEHTAFTKPLLIVDVSCDYTKPNNPIKIYSTPTTFASPIQKYGDFVKIIAIENLPSIVPEKSSVYFSKKCKDLLLNADVDVWERCGKAFLAC